MKKILIINLKKYGDIFYMAHAINSLKEKYSNSQISLLVFKESLQAAKVLKNINGVFSIDRKKILSLLRKDIYSDGLSINNFLSDTSALEKKRWDFIFNYSNDTVSSYITSFLTEDNDAKFVGVKIGNSGDVEYSNHWSKIFNEFIVQHQQSPFPLAHCYAQILSSPVEIDVKDSLLINKKHDQVVEKHFSLLRDETGKQKKIVGIVVSASTPQKSIPEETLFKVLNELYKEKHIAPTIIHAPVKSEKDIIKRLIKRLKKNVVTIECDLIAAISVIRHCDVLITPDTSLKHIADLVGTPSVEVSLSEAPLFKQSTLFGKSLILSAPIYERRFNSSYSDNMISFHDIVVACKHILFHSGLGKLSEDVVAYKPVYDRLGPYIKILYGKSNIFDEITRIMLRHFIYKSFHDRESVINTNDVLKYGESCVRNWTRLHKSEISKSINTVVRIFSIIENVKHNKQEFIPAINSLLKDGEQFSLAGLCVSLFKGFLENLSGPSVDNNLFNFKSNLRKLKENLKTADSFIEEVEGRCFRKRDVEKLLHGP